MCALQPPQEQNDENVQSVLNLIIGAKSNLNQKPLGQPNRQNVLTHINIQSLYCSVVNVSKTKCENLMI